MYAVMNVSLLFFFCKICHWTYFNKSSSSTELLNHIVSDYSDENNFLSLFNFFSFIFWLILFIFFFFIFCSCCCCFCCCFNSSNVIKFIRWSKSKLKEVEIFKKEESSVIVFAAALLFFAAVDWAISIIFFEDVSIVIVSSFWFMIADQLNIWAEFKDTCWLIKVIQHWFFLFLHILSWHKSFFISILTWLCSESCKSSLSTLFFFNLVIWVADVFVTVETDSTEISSLWVLLYWYTKCIFRFFLSALNLTWTIKATSCQDRA